MSVRRTSGYTRQIIVSQPPAIDFSSRSMIIRMNGHDHQVHDFISDTINQIYSSQTTAIYNYLVNQAKSQGQNPHIEFPQTITSFTVSVDALGSGKLIINLPNWVVEFDDGTGYCDPRIHATFGVTITADLKIVSDSLAYNLNIMNAKAGLVSFKSWAGYKYGHGWCYADIFDDVGLLFVDVICKYVVSNLLDGRTISLDNTTIPLFKYASVYQNATQQQIDEIKNSFPINITLSNYERDTTVILPWGAPVTFPIATGIMLGMNFMEGTSPSDKSFTSYNPTTPTNPTFDNIGFALPYYAFQNALAKFPNHPPTSDPLTMQTLLLNAMQTSGTQSVRISVPWIDFSPLITQTSGLDTATLNGVNLDIIVNQWLSANSLWANTDSILERALRNKFDVTLNILQSESECPQVNGGTMAPDGTPGRIWLDASNNNKPYYFVNGVTYIYWLKVFSHAAVRRYRNKIAIWAIECELDAARIASLAGWRHGSLWQDDNQGGFQDRLWKTLVQAVRQEDPTARILSAFHMLDIVKGLQRFGSDLDIIGVNFYPNNYFAYPILGFAVGEQVWATRRALIGLGLYYKPDGSTRDVFVTETNYPGIVNDLHVDLPVGSSINAFLNWYSYGRQGQYLNDAIQTSLSYGAKGFFYWAFLDNETYSKWEGYCNYGSLVKTDTLYNGNLMLKSTTGVFQGLTSSPSIYPGKTTVTLTNKSVSNPNLNGFVALMSERDSLKSGDSVYTIKNRNHISQTYQQFMQGLKHQSWNQNSPEFLLKQNFTPILSSIPRSALFAPTAPVTLQASCIEGGTGTDTLGYLDPWYKDGSGNQQNAFRNIILASNFKDSIFLGQGGQDIKHLQPPYYSVSAPLTINFGGSVGVRNMSLWNWTASPANSAAFQDTLARQTGVVFNSNNAVITANLKGIHLSNNSSAFSNNSQRKLVRTHDGWLHQVYESGGRVWLEESTDQGTTWFLGNNSQPLDNGAGKCPSIDWYYNNYVNDSTANSFVIVFQQQSGSTYTIQYAPFWRTTKNGGYVNQSVYPGYGKSNLLYPPAAGTPLTDPYTNNANPNISWGYNYNFVLTFEMKTSNGTLNPGIYWIYGQMYETQLYSQTYPDPYYYGPILVSGTNGNSVNAAVNLNKGLSGSFLGDFDVVYEQDVASHTSSIMDVTAYCIYNNGWQTAQYPFGALSSSTGISNYKPSMVQMPDASIRACWICSLNGDTVNSPYSVNVVYWNSVTPSQYTYFGMNTQSVSLNLRDDNARSYFAWSQNWNNGWSNSLSNGSSYITLGTAGKDVQLSNGPDSSGNTKMYTSAFYPFTLPYYFQTSGAVGSQLQKITTNQITYGRGVVLRKGDVQFNYSLKSLTVDNNNIKFIDIPETPAYKIPDSLSTDRLQARTAMRKWKKENDSYSKLDSLNTVLLSEPFAITGKSSIVLSEQAGFLDTSSAVKALGGNGHITYKLELVDYATNKTIAAIKESKFTSKSLSPCRVSASNLNVDKVGTKTVRVKITISTNITDLQTALVSEFGTVDNIALAKSDVKELTLQAPEIITEYALEQNYPNPFNPTTTIHYQIPNAGYVTLRIYDILGREVATLIDGMENMGSYSVTFDGGRLASGVYLMRLITKSDEGKSFVKVRKLVLMK